MTGNPAIQDDYGHAISTESATAADHYKRGLELYLLGNRGSEEALGDAIAADPDLAVAHSALAAILKDTNRHEDAASSAQRGADLAAGLSRREAQHTAAIAALMNGHGASAHRLMTEHLGDYPRDALIGMRADRYLFYSGGQDRHRRQLDQLEGL